MSIELADGTRENLSVAHQGAVVIGRDPSCHVVLPSPDVSRRHLTVEAIDGGYRITDKSANGTMVGGTLLRGGTTMAPGGIAVVIGPYVVHLPPIAGAMAAAPAFAPNPAPPLGSAAPPAGYAPPHHPPAEARSPKHHAPPPAGGGGAPASPSTMPAPATPARKEASPYNVSGTADVSIAARKQIHRLLLDHLDLASLDRGKMDDNVMRPKVRQALRSIVRQLAADLPKTTDHAQLIDEITDEALGLGPLEPLLADADVSEIMVVDPYTIYAERKGKLELTALRFTDDESVRSVIERIVTPLGRRIDESTPLVDARLADGSRVNAVIKPLAIRGSCITIRKFSKNPLKIENLIEFGSMTARMAKFVRRSVHVRKNIVISGGTGSGKTTLLNVLSAEIPEEERVVTVEDAAELQLVQPHVVSLETRPANMEGKVEYTIRDLVKNALRMRPDRIIVGECRGGEALDMLQAMNTGHEGSMTTTHANSPPEALARLETLALMSGLDLPSRAIREQIAQSVNLILQQTRFSDGSRRITSIAEVVGMNDEGDIEVSEIFRFVRTGTGPGGKIIGEFRATGYLPSFVDEFIAHGLTEAGDYL